MSQARRTYGPDLHILVIALACAGSMSTVARQYRLSQPTVRARIDEAEALAGCALFERTQRGTVATAHCRSLIGTWLRPDNV